MGKPYFLDLRDWSLPHRGRRSTGRLAQQGLARSSAGLGHRAHPGRGRVQNCERNVTAPPFISLGLETFLLRPAVD
jgi:hypothetical protein